MPPSAPTTLRRLTANWRALAGRADPFFDQVLAAQGEHMRCGPGCDACCQQDLALCLLEGIVLLSGLERLPDPERQALAQAALIGAPPCPLLDARGQCTLYDVRPIICRTHGLPILYREEGQAEGSLSVCHLNFTGCEIPAGAVLDGGVLSAGLVMADGLVRQELGLPPGEERFKVSELVAGGWDSLPDGASRVILSAPSP